MDHEKQYPSTIYEHAMSYHAMGLTVLPAKGKKCSAHKWVPFKKERPAIEKVKRWFRSNNHNILLMCGGELGLFVRDFDTKAGYEAWAAEYERDAGNLPTAETKNGFHVYGSISKEQEAEIRAHFGKTGDGAIYLGDGELRMGEGSLVIAPPSIHPDLDENAQQVLYQWVTPLNFDTLHDIEITDCGLHLTWDGNNSDTCEHGQAERNGTAT